MNLKAVFASVLVAFALGHPARLPRSNDLDESPKPLIEATTAAPQWYQFPKFAVKNPDRALKILGNEFKKVGDLAVKGFNEAKPKVEEV